LENFTDEKLMQLVKQDKLDMMSHLFNRYHLRIYNFSLLMTRDKDISNDITQEVFYKAIKYRRTYKNAKFSSWIYSIARNLCNDHFRSLRKTEQKIEDLRFTSEQDESHKIEPIGSVEQLNSALKKLSIGDRELIIMSRYQGMRYSEIAEITGSTVGAVKTKIHRALQKLKDHYFANKKHYEL